MTTTAFQHWSALHAWWCARQHEREAVGRQWAPRKTRADVPVEEADDRTSSARSSTGTTPAVKVPLPPDEVLTFNFVDRTVTVDTPPLDIEVVNYSNSRLALVDARAQLNADPDQGADVDEVTFAAAKAHYGRLDPAAKAWIAELIGQAKRRGVTFHARDVRSVRVFELYRGLIALAAAGGDDDEILRALLAEVVGDVALMPGVEPGHVVGSLDWREASRFAAIVDEYNTGGVPA